MKWDAVMGYHMNPLTCGVAKFNTELARRLAVPYLSLTRDRPSGSPLVSIKPSELPAGAHAWLGRKRFDVLLHGDSPPWVDAAREVFWAKDLGCPATLTDRRILPGPDAELTVCSFGMAHKIRADLYARLAEILKATKQTYAVYLSSALHDGTVFDGRFEAAVGELSQLFDGSVYFLGYLSDVALYNQLLDADVCAAFFEGGVQANNTSVHTAMQAGAVVVTNLGAGSPPSFVHAQTLYDIQQLRVWPSERERHAVRFRARALNAREFSWEAWMARFSATRVLA